MNKEEVLSFLDSRGYAPFYNPIVFKHRLASDLDTYDVASAFLKEKTGDIFWHKSKENVELYKKVLNLFIPYHEQDGLSHINVYSKGKTNLGKFLSNFTKCEIETEDGPFKSIEGYWYWLGCGEEELRNLWGFEAKKYGRSVRAADWQNSEEFKNKICSAIKYKICHSNHKSWFINEWKEFDHYYVYGDRLVRPKEGHWVIDYLNSLKTELSP